MAPLDDRRGLPIEAGDGAEIDFERALVLLERGDLQVEGQIAWSSNISLLCRLQDVAGQIQAVYKPRQGERPLWDFPRGSLHLRELAAWQLSQALGWWLVPPTVIREGPYGAGMLQAFVPHDPQEHYLAMDAPDPKAVARISAFDVVINNADRKSGHVLRDPSGGLWAIDHGIAFHAEPKLRTVIWEMAGRPLDPEIATDLGRLARTLADPTSTLQTALEALLEPEECQALLTRTRALIDAGAYPDPDPERRMIPWPPV